MSRASEHVVLDLASGDRVRGERGAAVESNEASSADGALRTRRQHVSKPVGRNASSLDAYVGEVGADSDAVGAGKGTVAVDAAEALGGLQGDRARGGTGRRTEGSASLLSRQDG